MDSDSPTGAGRSPEESSISVGCLITACVVLALFVGLLLVPTLQRSSTPSRSRICCSRLKQISIALQYYHDTWGRFPPRCLYDADGTPLHSWRVILLPYFEEERLRQLGSQIRLDEPWNSADNWALIEQTAPEGAPYVFRCPSAQGDPHDTTYVAVNGDETAWPDRAPLSIPNIADGTSRTISVVEVANSGIHWAEPRDLPLVQALQGINPPHVKLSISSGHLTGANLLFCDGAVHFLENDTPRDTLRALLTAAGGEDVRVPE